MEPSRFIPLGDVVFVEKTADGVLLGVGDEKFRVDVLRPDLLRLKILQAGRFDEHPTFATSFQVPSAPPFGVVESEASITVDTGRVRLVIARRPFSLAAYRADGSVIFEDHRENGVNGANGNGGHYKAGYVQLNDSFIVTRRITPHDS